MPTRQRARSAPGIRTAPCSGSSSSDRAIGGRNHRTDSLDYAVVLSGEIDMDLDGEEVHLKAGDVIVQRGTIHNWINRGKEPCVIAFVLIDAKPVTAGGKLLNAVG